MILVTSYIDTLTTFSMGVIVEFSLVMEVFSSLALQSMKGHRLNMLPFVYHLCVRNNYLRTHPSNVLIYFHILRFDYTF